MKAQILTTEQITNCEGREYNPQIWQSNINRIVGSFNNVTFYVVYKGDGYDYNRYYVQYTTNEGLNLFSSFGYSYSIDNCGFYRVDKSPITKDGKTYADVIKLSEEGKANEIPQLIKDLEGSIYLTINFGKFYNEQLNKMVMIGTNKEAIDWMIDMSVKHGLIFSKG